MDNLIQKRQITGEVAEKFTHNIVRTWKPSSEIWSFKYGNEILPAMNALNSAFFVHSVRKQLKLRPHAPVTCYGPVVALSYVLTDLIQSQYITREILQMRDCPLCTTAKAAIFQASLGVAYPMLLAPLIGFFVADRKLTYPVPSIHRAPMELFRLWMKLVLTNPRPIFVSIALQMAAATWVTVEKQSFVWNYLNSTLSVKK